MKKIRETIALLHSMVLSGEKTDGTVTQMVKDSMDRLVELEREVLSGAAVFICPELDDEVRFILGRPNFTLISIANRLRELGYKIDKKAEDEQAVVIHWMLGLYEKRGKDWRNKIATELQEMDTCKTKTGEQYVFDTTEKRNSK